MTSVVAKFAAKKIMGDGLKQFSQRGKKNGPESAYDPYFDVIWDERKGRSKKVKKQVPSYIPEHDAIILAKMRRRSYRLDMGLFSLFGIRFGWSSVIGLVPAFGDVGDLMLALLLVWNCGKVECGLGGVKYHMLFNVAIDFLVGIIPFLGDLADAAYKANTRNVRLLEERLDEVYKPKDVLRREKEQRRSWRPRGKDDVRGKPPAPATVYEEFSDTDSDRNEPYSSNRRNGHGEPKRPQEARVPAETRGGPAPDRKKSQKYNSRSGRQRPHDEEMGIQQSGVSGR